MFGAVDRGLEVLMLDVGQGDASIIRPPDGPPVIFDCKDAHVVLRTLEQRGDHGSVAAVIFSHLDRDQPAVQLRRARGGSHIGRHTGSPGVGASHP